MWRLCSSLSLMERLPWSRWTWRPFLRNWRWRARCGGIRIGIVIEAPTLGLPTQTLCSHDAWSAWHLRDNRPLFKQRKESTISMRSLFRLLETRVWIPLKWGLLNAASFKLLKVRPDGVRTFSMKMLKKSPGGCGKYRCKLCGEI